MQMLEVFDAVFCSLHVRETNYAAMQLYSKTLGYVINDRAIEYYADGEDAYDMRCYFDRDGPECRAFVPKFKGNFDHLPIKDTAYKRALGLVEYGAQDRVDEAALDASAAEGKEGDADAPHSEGKERDAPAAARAMPKFARKASKQAMGYHLHDVGGEGAARDHPDLSASDRHAVDRLLKHASHHAGEGKEAEEGDGGVDGIVDGIGELSVGGGEGKAAEAAEAAGSPAAARAEPPAAPSANGTK